MPNINIHEVDRTAGQTDYGSEVLSIALAGGYNASTWNNSKDLGRVDDNNIIKLSSLRDFYDYVGKSEVGDAEAIYANLDLYQANLNLNDVEDLAKGYNEADTDNSSKILVEINGTAQTLINGIANIWTTTFTSSEIEYVINYYTGIKDYLYLTNGSNSLGITAKEYYSDFTDKIYAFGGTSSDIVITEAGEEPRPALNWTNTIWMKTTVISKQTSSDTETDPKTFDVYYKLTQVSAWNPENWSDWQFYVILNSGGIAPKSADENSNVTLGNQMAAMLLNTGYTVYYKGIASDSEISDPGTWEAFKDKDAYDFRFIASGVYKELLGETKTVGSTTTVIGKIDANTIATAYQQIADVARSRGDATALIDVFDNIYYSENTKANLSISGKINAIKANVAQYIPTENPFVAIFTSGVKLKADFGEWTNRELPGSFRYLDCFATMINNGYAEWYAVANTARGGNGNYPINQVSATIGSIMFNELEPRVPDTYSIKAAVNPIATTKEGFVLMGNRTAAAITTKDLTAVSFLNIRQLITSISKQVYNTCKIYQFDPNSDTLWVNFKNGITPLLDRMVSGEGIRDYEIVKVKSQKKAELRAKIRIVPIEAVEDFDIEISLENDLATVTVAE